jgi:hypothetical protein
MGEVIPFPARDAEGRVANLGLANHHQRQLKEDYQMAEGLAVAARMLWAEACNLHCRTQSPELRQRLQGAILVAHMLHDDELVDVLNLARQRFYRSLTSA